MTTATGQSVDARVSMRFVFDGSASYDLSSLAQTFRDLQVFLIVSHYVELARQQFKGEVDRPTTESVIKVKDSPDVPVREVEDPRDSIKKNHVSRVSLASPLDATVVLAATGSALTAARGVLYLVDKWHHTRVSRARAEWQIAAFKLAEDELRNLKVQGGHAVGLNRGIMIVQGEKAPDNEEMTAAARILERLDRVEVDKQGSHDAGAEGYLN